MLKRAFDWIFAPKQVSTRARYSVASFIDTIKTNVKVDTLDVVWTFLSPCCNRSGNDVGLVSMVHSNNNFIVVGMDSIHCSYFDPEYVSKNLPVILHHFQKILADHQNARFILLVDKTNDECSAVNYINAIQNHFNSIWRKPLSIMIPCQNGIKLSVTLKIEMMQELMYALCRQRVLVSSVVDPTMHSRLQSQLLSIYQEDSPSQSPIAIHFAGDSDIGLGFIAACYFSTHLRLVFHEVDDWILCSKV